MRSTTGCGLALFVAVSLGRAAAQTIEVPGKGGGSGRASTTTPPTRSTGTAPESASMAARDLPFSTRPGILGAPGAAPDEAGPARLGGHGERSSRPSWGESAQPMGGGEAGLKVVRGQGIVVLPLFHKIGKLKLTARQINVQLTDAVTRQVSARSSVWETV